MNVASFKPRRAVALQQTTYAVPPVARAFKLLRHIAAGDTVANMSLSARALGISRTTLIRLIATLETEQMIERVGDGAGYKLGLGLAALAGQSLAASDIVQAGDTVISGLAEKLGLSAHIGVLEGRDVLYVARRAPNVHLVSNVSVGSRLPAHATTLGRIILAFMPRQAVGALYQGVRLKPATAKTPTTLAALLTQIDADCATGLAWSDSNYERGIASVAAPVFDRMGHVAGAINVTGPSVNFASGTRTTEIGAAVRDAAAHISRRLGFVPADRVARRRTR